ncbi:hypothetical protein [Sandaracinus amylolyticus]|uniref:Uncharacterized protein n=1 Tax=Sandaracinus amylolyticus TaxID=927083 RepID=A0A0F6YHG5_9BACT|nr:hypothetical protein [Sandaracinus amylolyticus]AKF05122.1 hypothetical protein DB32_002271 [Sandaracinus amylolyticus]
MNAFERFACELARLSALIPGLGITVVAFVPSLLVIATSYLLGRAARALPGGRGRPSHTPTWVAASLVAVALYGLARIADPFLRDRLHRPEDVDPALWERVSYFEWRLLGAPWGRPLVPLDAHPDVAIALHTIVWLPIIALVALLLERFVVSASQLAWSTKQEDLPFFHRWVGASTTRRADDRFRRWARPLWIAIFVAHGIAGWLFYVRFVADEPPGMMACREGQQAAPVRPAAYADDPIEQARDDARPAPGAWVLALYLLTVLGVHLATQARPPAEQDEKKAEDEAKAPPPEPAIERLRAALAEAPGAPTIAKPMRTPARAAETAALPERTAALAAEAFHRLTGQSSLYAHQRDVLEHLASMWRTAPPTARGAAPELREEAMGAPFRGAEGALEHPLVLLPEGTGRTALCALAALQVFLDRGATTLVVTRDAPSARAFAERVRDAVQRTAARWNAAVAVAGDDLAATLLAERTPAIVVAHLEALESDVLSDARTEAIFKRLGLWIVLDVEGFTGVREMHLHMLARRTWALLDALHDAPYPALLLATAGPSASGIAGWARHLLAAPLRVFERDGAPRPAHATITRRDLRRDDAREVTIAELAEACARAGLRWHLRLAGDAWRGIARSTIDLAHVPGHVADPLDAEIVMIEGRWPDVRREADRLAHAGQRVAPEGETLVILAPPRGDELALHDEAEDAPFRALTLALPRAVPLSEPEVVRQRHFDRALGREQDVDALRTRFGAPFVDETLRRLEASGRVARRAVLEFDARIDDARARAKVRSTSEAAIGEPICDACVGESTSRVRLVDEGTRDVLRELDLSTASALHPPGSLALHARGRYLVRESASEPGLLLAAHGQPPGRTTPDRRVAIEVHAKLELSERSLGGAPIPIAIARAEVTETFHGIRRYAPGPRLVERRSYAHPIASVYSTEACLVVIEPALPRAAEIALATAIRAMLPCLLRASEDLIDVEVVRLDERVCLALFDRTPGASGLAQHLHHEGIGDLLRLARLALERLVGAETAPLRALYDTREGAEREPWDARAALAWLDRVLDAAPEDDAPARERAARVEHEPGEGTPGDLGRVWIALEGRTEDLVWTRHAWISEVAIGGAPPGQVHLDVAFERGAIARALDEAASATDDLGAWSELVARAEADLAPLASRLIDLAGPAYPELVLGLVAAIPTRARPLAPAERAPLVTLVRRRADAPAKALLALSLLRAYGSAQILESTRGPLVRTTIGDRDRVVDLTRDPPRVVSSSEVAAARVRLG